MLASAVQGIRVSKPKLYVAWSPHLVTDVLISLTPRLLGRRVDSSFPRDSVVLLVTWRVPQQLRLGYSLELSQTSRNQTHWWVMYNVFSPLCCYNIWRFASTLAWSAVVQRYVKPQTHHRQVIYRQPHSSLTVSDLPVPAPTTSSQSVNSPVSPSINSLSLSLPAQNLPLLQIFPNIDSLSVSALTLRTLWQDRFWASRFLWPPYGIGQAIIFSSCGFFFFYLSVFFLSRRTLDVYHTSTHGVALVWI